MKRYILIVLTMLILLTRQAIGQTYGKISGSVIDDLTKETLIGANIIIQGTTRGTSTDLDGRFILENISAGIYNLEVSYIGYKSLTITDVVVYSNKTTQRTIELQVNTIEGEEVLVTSGYYTNVERKDISRVTFNPEEIRRSPGAGMEVARILNTVPGVASTGDMSQDLLVRGGSVNENGFYVDNIYVPTISHFRERGGQSNGPIGLINTEMIKNIEFSTGGFPASYGDRMSSIAMIDYRDPSQNGSQGKFGATLAGFLVEIDGSTTDKSGLLLSARRSYLDLIADALNTGGAPRFEDYQGKYQYRINKNHSLDVLAIYGWSQFKQTRQQSIDIGDVEYVDTQKRVLTAGMNWKFLHTNGFTQTSFSISRLSDDLDVKNVDTRNATIDQKIINQTFNTRSVTSQRLSNNLNVEYGAEIIFENSQSDYFFAESTNDFGIQIPAIKLDDQIKGVLYAAFATVNFDITPLTTLSAGARVNSNSYNNQINIDPRITIGQDITEKWKVNASWGLFTQTLPRFLISQKSEFEKLKSTTATHYILGTSYMLTPDTRLTLEGFYKTYSDAPMMTLGSQYGDLGFVLDKAAFNYDKLDNSGEAWARGLELMVQKKLAKDFYGSLSASYFRTQYRDSFGNWKNRDFDNKILFNVIGGYRPSDTWEVSVRWTYLGGRPTTPLDPIASQQANNTRRFTTPEAINSKRLSPYHSLFFRFDRRWFYNRFSLVSFLEIWNTYNNDNVLVEFWNRDDQKIDQALQFSFLPIGGFILEF